MTRVKVSGVPSVKTPSPTSHSVSSAFSIRYLTVAPLVKSKGK
ncbi:MAG: hypothetical protein OEV44_01055 [Spirochaetota bacterium]|nr:hypothetical protein [Spirochaetota bacterium]